ncbi:uncharacterized protein LOC110022736 [Phalaenopsis equestris]|uniref:uncharacterized protein LOC110022736 n=1 Tax=Phalaenopsis equestris TaxID=78828 RepID=UPI0009E5CA35|nr:uncharacterized protein LOC110022736 [Phalaenopsis equestris]
MRAAILNRTASMSTVRGISGVWPTKPAGGHDAGLSFYRRSSTHRMPLDVRQRRNFSSSAVKPNQLRRVRSDTDLFLSSPQSFRGETWPPSALLASVEEDDLCAGVVAVKENNEVEYSGGSGKGKGSKSKGGSFGDGGNEEKTRNRMIENHYQEMLRADPENPLLLSNYGRFLHEVGGDLKKAEDCYGRAILACPDDGEVLSRYARFIWDTQKDCERAEAYHERAVEASPDDCYVLGSYAHFLWDAEEGEGEGMVGSSSPFVEVC